LPQSKKIKKLPVVEPVERRKTRSMKNRTEEQGNLLKRNKVESTRRKKANIEEEEDGSDLKLNTSGDSENKENYFGESPRDTDSTKNEDHKEDSKMSEEGNPMELEQ